MGLAVLSPFISSFQLFIKAFLLKIFILVISLSYVSFCKYHPSDRNRVLQAGINLALSCRNNGSRHAKDPSN